MQYKIVKVADRYFVLTRAMVKKGSFFVKKLKKEWVRADPFGKPFTVNETKSKHDRFFSLDEAYKQIERWEHKVEMDS